MTSLPFRKLPIEIVKCILPYDRRFIIRNGNIILIDKLNFNKYSNIIQLLLNKPPIEKHIVHKMNDTLVWAYYYVTFSNNKIIHYDINYVCQLNEIYYSYCFYNDYCYEMLDGMSVA
jgi:hypothetical protein